MNVVLDVADLRVEFAGMAAVRDVGFYLEAGEVLGIVGESGCGKSVTCTSLLGLMPYSAQIVSGRAMFGEVDLLSLDGRSLNQLRGRDISYIFQNSTTSLNPILTVGRQIMEPLVRHQGVPREKARQMVVDLLHKVGVSDPERRMGNFPHQFSGGMNQRVMIAMALACRPRILIADEPTTALDVTIQAQILSLLGTLAAETGTAVILITHDLGIVASMADRIAVMYAGSIIETGHTRDVFHSPRHPYTRGLLDSRPRIDRRTHRLSAIEGTVPSITERISGCQFAPRCARAMPVCHETPPAMTVLSPVRQYACYNPVAPS